MRKIILISVWLLFSSELIYSQTNSFPSSGDAGIGTTTPTTRLVIQANSNDNLISFRNSAAITKGYIGTAVTDGQMIPGSNSNDLIVRSESQKIIFSTDAGNTAAMRIDVNGNVGIGTAPAYKLDVNGKVMARGGLILSGYAAQNNSLSFASGGLYLEGTTGGSIYMRPNGTGNNTGLFTLSPTGFASIGDRN